MDVISVDGSDTSAYVKSGSVEPAKPPVMDVLPGELPEEPAVADTGSVDPKSAPVMDDWARAGKGSSGPDVGDVAAIGAVSIEVTNDRGNWLFASLDRRVALMSQDLAAFGAGAAETSVHSHARNADSSSIDFFAA